MSMNTILTDSQFTQLEAKIKSAGLQRRDLYHDLLDHYYCLTTCYMDQGYAFEESARLALGEFAPEGLPAIEKDLEFLLTFNFQISMKRLLYSGALVATVGQTLYVLFKNLHWPGANFALSVGVFGLFFMVLPALLVQFKSRAFQSTSLDKFRFYSGFIGIALFGMGSFFKIMHWNGANAQLVVGTGILALFFFPVYFWQQYRQSLTQMA